MTTTKCHRTSDSEAISLCALNILNTTHHKHTNTLNCKIKYTYICTAHTITNINVLYIIMKVLPEDDPIGQATPCNMYLYNIEMCFVISIHIVNKLKLKLN